ncbi:MAG: LamG domain-containing protein [Leptospirales bacterium]|nr:LamG domain-containing protein [Leptospirales bacterium]
MLFLRSTAILILLLASQCARYNATQGWFALLALNSPSGPWWDRSWSARRPITINNTGGALPGMPVLVHLTSANFSFSTAQASGADVCFTSAASVQLPSEKDVFTSSDAAFWIRTDLASGDNSIYVYYGSSSSCPSAGSVWDSSYRAVYHLSSDPSSAVPDSANTNSLTATAMTAANLTATNSTYGMTFNGTTQYLKAPDSATLRIPSNASIEVIYRANPYSANAHYLVEKGDSDFDNYALYLKKNGAFTCTAAVGCAAFEFRDASSTYVDVTGTVPMTTGTYHTLAANLNDTSNQVDFYLDGAFAETRAGALPGNTWAQPLSVGAQNFGAANFFFSGIIDEVRISDTLRSADYYAFTHRNVTLGLTPQVGAQETQ